MASKHVTSFVGFAETEPGISYITVPWIITRNQLQYHGSLPLLPLCITYGPVNGIAPVAYYRHVCRSKWCHLSTTVFPPDKNSEHVVKKERSLIPVGYRGLLSKLEFIFPFKTPVHY